MSVIIVPSGTDFRIEGGINVGNRWRRYKPRFIWIPARGPVNLLNPSVLATITGTPTILTDGFVGGLAKKGGESTGYNFGTALSAGSGDFSVFIVASYVSSTSGVVAGGGLYSNGGANAGWYIQTDDPTANTLYVRFNTNGTPYVNTAPVDSKTRTIGFSYKYAGVPEIYVNGAYANSTSVTSYCQVAGNYSMIGHYGTNSALRWGGNIALVALFDAWLSPYDHRDLARSPKILFEQAPRRTYFFPSAGGGGATITAGSGSFALTGTAVSLKANRVLAAASGSFALTGSDVSLRVGRKLAADSGTYSLTGTDVAFKRGYALSAESGTYTLNGTDVSLKAGRKLTADSGTYALTGTNVTLTHNSAGSYTLVAESGSYSLTGTAVSLTVNRKLAADSGTYALTGSNATLTKGYTLTAASGTYTLTGSNVAFARTYRLTAESGAYTLTGSNASIVWSGAPVDSGPDTSGGGSGPRVLLRERKVREEVDEWLAKKAQADLLKKIQREDEEICLIMALLAA